MLAFASALIGGGLLMTVFCEDCLLRKARIFYGLCLETAGWQYA